MAAFVASDPFPGASAQTRRSLGNLGDHTSARRILESAARLRVKAKRPVWLTDAWAHVGFPDLHVAVVILCSGFVSTQREVYRAKWKEAGWDLLTVEKGRVERMSDAELDAELREALSLSKKGGKR